jgi:hypothetical protein
MGQQTVTMCHDEPIFQVSPGYGKLAITLQDALNQAQAGKGMERHGTQEPFEKQITMLIEGLGVGFQLGQAIKKVTESVRLDKDRSINELLGAITYIAAHIIFLKESDTGKETFAKKLP